jgi:DNA-binding NarL/FixJ family response regulator
VRAHSRCAQRLTRHQRDTPVIGRGAHIEIPVVVADDQGPVRSGFALILDADLGIEVVAQAANGAEALTAARLHLPQVVVLDLQMPGMDVRRMRLRAGLSQRSRTPTTSSTVNIVGGGDAYSPRRSPPDSSGDSGQSAAERPSLVERSPLTPRELEVLDALARGLSNVEIAERFCQLFHGGDPRQPLAHQAGCT